MTSPRRAVLTAVLTALLAAPALVGCSSDSGTPSAGPGSATATTSSPSASGSATASAPTGDSPYPVYVALGDSYTAAPLVPTTDTGNGCLRSDHNYPALVAAAMPGTALTDVSCSGADSTSMIGVQETGDQTQPAQFDALSKDADLVTIGIGGNDFNLFATLVGVCSQLRDGDPTGNPCETKLRSGGGDTLTKELPKIRGHVRAIVAGIKDRAPNAKVIVVGYPQIIPSSGTCPKLLPLADGDYPFARRINQGLADAVEAGAAKADAYVDMFAASKGHDICSDDPWINGAATDATAALAFHPFAAEQQAAADLVLEQLR
ncbi:SGNH/GDSL hydrolase family protein [Nocardioides sp. KIGAM211]|uniref:SGNH/GDSL hydrolase family protein n=1 Tax=Nocardioides luti TaxID=2761101 RepID=A0A7X0RHC0_9ACTN|nr:SGNH/GDSL hydrolase family protein [Nocardioides luti]MBB6628165.1 SGNH/GDSL hydrolase family protein [Nocardioides luti]